MTTYRQGRRPLHEYLRHHARATPDKAAVVWYGRRMTYAELDDLSERFARCLHDRGIGQGDVIVLFLHNCPDFLIAHLGAQKLGVIVSPCNPMSKAIEFAHQVRELGASALVVGDELLGVVESSGVLGTVRHVFSTHYGRMLPAVISVDVPDEIRLPGEPGPALPAFAIDLGRALANAEPLHGQTLVDVDEVALMAYTSGSTGLPKCSMLSYESALYKAAVSAECFGIGGEDVLLADTALHHISGMITGVAIPVYTGATVVLLYRFDAPAVLQAIEYFRVSWWYTMAPSLPAVMGVDNGADFDLSSLRTTIATSFGMQLTESLARRWSEFANGCVVHEAGYGLSETHTCDTIMPRDAIRWGTNGKAVPGVELRIVDPDTGVELPLGERGEILLRSPVRFRGYWGRPQDTAEALLDGWTRTGDIGLLDADGYLTFLGRHKEMIKVWSYSVFPEEVERILSTHPDVKQVAVVGCPDPICGESLKAYVVLDEVAVARTGGARPRETEARIIQWCFERMAHFKVPRAVIVRHSLPATCSGKVLRRLLRQSASSAPASLRFAYR